MKMKLYECACCGEKCKWEDVTEAPDTSTGWLCHECFYIVHPEYLEWGEY